MKTSSAARIAAFAASSSLRSLSSLSSMRAAHFSSMRAALITSLYSGCSSFAMRTAVVWCRFLAMNGLVTMIADVGRSRIEKTRASWSAPIVAATVFILRQSVYRER